MLYELINLMFQVLFICLIVRVILSWIPHNPYNEIIRWIYKITEPMLRPIREILPPMNIGIDISPIIAFIALGLIRKIVIWMLF